MSPTITASSYSEYPNITNSSVVSPQEAPKFSTNATYNMPESIKTALKAPSTVYAATTSFAEFQSKAHRFLTTFFKRADTSAVSELKKLAGSHPVILRENLETIGDFIDKSRVNVALIDDHISNGIKLMDVKSVRFSILTDKYDSRQDLYLAFELDPTSRSRTHQFDTYIDQYLLDYDSDTTKIFVTIV